MKKRYLIFILFLLALVIRVSYVQDAQPEYFNLGNCSTCTASFYNIDNFSDLKHISITHDTTGYIMSQRGISKYFMYGIVRVNKWNKMNISARPLVYPFFLYFTFLNANELFYLTIMVLIDCMSTILIFLISYKMFKDKRVAFLAGLMYTVFPVPIIMIPYLMSDVLGNLLFLIFLYFFIFSLEEDKYRWIILSAFFLAISVLTRPVFQYFYIISGILLFIPVSFKKGKIQFSIIRLKKALLFILFLLIFISPWLVFQYQINGSPYISHVDDFTYCAYHASHFMSYREDIPFNESQNKLDCDWSSIQKNLEEGRSMQEIIKKLRVNGRGYIISQPGEYIYWSLNRTSNQLFVTLFWSSVYASDFLIKHFNNNYQINQVRIFDEFYMNQKGPFMYVWFIFLFFVSISLLTTIILFRDKKPVFGSLLMFSIIYFFAAFHNVLFSRLIIQPITIWIFQFSYFVFNFKKVKQLIPSRLIICFLKYFKKIMKK